MADYDEYISTIVTPILREGEQEVAMGYLYKDTPLIITLLAIITYWIRYFMMRHYLVMVTNQRIIMIRTGVKFFSFSLTPKLENRGVESLEFCDVTGFMPGRFMALRRLTFVFADGSQRQLTLPPNCKQIAGHSTLYANCQTWVQGQLEAGYFAALPKQGDKEVVTGASSPATPAARKAPIVLLIVSVVLILGTCGMTATSCVYCQDSSRARGRVGRHQTWDGETASAQQATTDDSYYRRRANQNLLVAGVFGAFGAFMFLGGLGLGFLWLRKRRQLKIEDGGNVEEGHGVDSGAMGNPAPAPAQAPVPAQAPHPTGGIAPGTPVLVTWPDGQQYPATAVQQNGDQVACTFQDGQQQWVPLASVRPQVKTD